MTTCLTQQSLYKYCLVLNIVSIYEKAKLPKCCKLYCNKFKNKNSKIYRNVFNSELYSNLPIIFTLWITPVYS